MKLPDDYIENIRSSLSDMVNSRDMQALDLISSYHLFKRRSNNLLPNFCKIGNAVIYAKKDIVEWLSQADSIRDPDLIYFRMSNSSIRRPPNFNKFKKQQDLEENLTFGHLFIPVSSQNIRDIKEKLKCILDLLND